MKAQIVLAKQREALAQESAARDKERREEERASASSRGAEERRGGTGDTGGPLCHLLLDFKFCSVGRNSRCRFIRLQGA